MSTPTCPTCGSRPSEVQYHELHVGRGIQRIPAVYTCPNAWRSDHRSDHERQDADPPFPRLSRWWLLRGWRK